ncbi:MAG: hypothetical protein ACYTF6_05220 [Planctomycetota bacterium]
MNLAEIKAQFVAELKADKRKAGLVSLLLVVAVFVGLRLTLRQGGEDAAPPAKASASVSTSNLPPEGSGGQAAGPAKSTSRAQRKEDYIRNLDRTIARDIFEPNPVFFPVRDMRKITRTSGQSARRTSAADQRQAHEKFIREQAKLLKLQSVVVGDMPTAIINDRVVRLGDWINGFKLVKISPQSCVVCKEDVEVPLKMEK